MKKETLEEAAEIYAEKWNDLENQFKLSSCFIVGAKWQQQRSYSEEEVMQLVSDWNIFDYHQDSFRGKDDLTFEQWLNKFKKK